jgi:hypothetical protein
MKFNRRKFLSAVGLGWLAKDAVAAKEEQPGVHSAELLVAPEPAPSSRVGLYLWDKDQQWRKIGEVEGPPLPPDTVTLNKTVASYFEGYNLIEVTTHEDTVPKYIRVRDPLTFGIEFKDGGKV